MEGEVQNSPFVKHLASSDKKTRDQALDSLRAFLSSRSEISDLDLLKLWKGLYYCLWMQDKPALQQRLARDLAALPSALKPDVVLPFFRAFWLTIAREWSQIEALRLDKYLYLIRQYVNASFKWLSKNEWKDKSKLEEYMEVLEEIPLNPVNMKIPNGLRFHVLDVYVDELEKVDDVWQTEKKSDTLDMLIRPVEKLTKDGKLKVIRKTAKECLDDDRVKAWRGEVTNEDQEMHDGDNDDDEEEEEEEWGGIVD